MATVQDISAMSGFSKATVSRVLSDDVSFSVSDETRNSILKCAQELNYVYKRKKKSVSKVSDMRNHRVGIVPIGLGETGQGELQDPYYLYIRNGVEERLNELGFHNVIIISMNSIEDYEKLEGLDSLIVIGKKIFDEENPYFKRIKNVVFIDWDLNHRKYDCVLSDFAGAVTEAIDFMMECGFRKIGYIGSWDYINDFANKKMLRRVDSRQITFEAYAEKMGLLYKPYLYIGGKFTKSVGYELAKKAVESGRLPEAFLIGSDPMAMGIYRAFGEAGVRIGTDIRLIGIDNIADSAYMNPSLTSMMVYTHQMGRSAADCLRQRIEGRTVPVKLMFPTALVERESCKKEKRR